MNYYNIDDNSISFDDIQGQFINLIGGKYEIVGNSWKGDSRSFALRRNNYIGHEHKEYILRDFKRNPEKENKLVREYFEQELGI